MGINRLATIGKKSGFIVNLWMDNEKNYYKTAIMEELIKPSNISLKDIDLLNIYMANDPFFQEKIEVQIPGGMKIHKKRAEVVQLYVKRELLGLARNPAAAADILRYVILYFIPSYYYDTDTEFFIEDNSILLSDELKYDILVNGFFKRDIFNGGNDIIATSIPCHEALKTTIDYTLERLNAYEVEIPTKKINIKSSLPFQEHNHVVTLGVAPIQIDKLQPNIIAMLKNSDGKLSAYWIEDGKIFTKSLKKEIVKDILSILPPVNEESFDQDLIDKIKSRFGLTPFMVTNMDLKRKKLDRYDRQVYTEDRNYLTVWSSGPYSLSYGMKNFIQFIKSSNKDEDLTNSDITPFLTKDLVEGGVTQIMGINLKSHSDNTWLQTNDNDLKSVIAWLNRELKAIENSLNDVERRALQEIESLMVKAIKVQSSSLSNEKSANGKLRRFLNLFEQSKNYKYEKIILLMNNLLGNKVNEILLKHACMFSSTCELNKQTITRILNLLLENKDIFPYDYHVVYLLSDLYRKVGTDFFKNCPAFKKGNFVELIAEFNMPKQSAITRSNSLEMLRN